MIISGFAAYVKQLWKNKPDTSTPLSAARLTHMEDGIEGNSDAIEKLAAAVVSQITNDPDKIASMAALYAVQQAAFPKTNLVSQIVNDETKAASAAALYSVNETLKQTNSNLSSKLDTGGKLVRFTVDPSEKKIGIWLDENYGTFVGTISIQ